VNDRRWAMQSMTSIPPIPRCIDLTVGTGTSLLPPKTPGRSTPRLGVHQCAASPPVKKQGEINSMHRLRLHKPPTETRNSGYSNLSWAFPPPLTSSIFTRPPCERGFSLIAILIWALVQLLASMAPPCEGQSRQSPHQASSIRGQHTTCQAGASPKL
jgi:hypothetical protein